MKFGFKNLLVASLVTATLVAAPAVTKAEIQCPMGWVKEVKDSVVVCVAQNQEQNQAQIQMNNQNQNVNQNVNATGGSSSSSSSSSSNTNVTVNNTQPTPAPTSIPQVVYQAQAKIVELPKTGLPETAMALSALLPAGFALKKFGFKKSQSTEESASSIWLEKQSH